jgi:uncharacterized OB-fold protein
MNASDTIFGDALTAPFWQGAAQHVLMIQHCAKCGHNQFYPRPFCLKCRSSSPTWIAASGLGTVYSRTVIRRSPNPAQPAPYVNALVDLDEGPRLFTSLTSMDCGIGERVRVTWREREDAPPLPIFEPAEH